MFEQILDELDHVINMARVAQKACLSVSEDFLDLRSNELAILAKDIRRFYQDKENYRRSNGYLSEILLSEKGLPLFQAVARFRYGNRSWKDEEVLLAVSKDLEGTGEKSEYAPYCACKLAAMFEDMASLAEGRYEFIKKYGPV